MADELAVLRDRLTVLERKVDGIMARVDHEVLEVSEGFAKQQEFILDLFHQVENELRALARKTDERFAQFERRFTQLEHRMDARFTLLDEKMDAGFSQVDKKLDRFIEAQTKLNRLTEARLRRLEAADRS